MTMQALKSEIYQIKSLNNWRIHFYIFIIAFTIIISRRPDALLNAQFWAEDGTVWYEEAYNLGVIHSLFTTHTGYFQTASRLSAGFAQLFPFTWAPLIFNLTAILIKILPVNLLASSRFELLIPQFYLRLFIGFLYLALPYSAEVHANITNAHWYLAILGCMIILATPSTLFIWQFFDTGIILLLALSGPFSIILVPIATIIWLRRRKKYPLMLLPCLYMGALVQGLAIFLTNSREPKALGATLALFTKITGQIFLGTLFGRKGLEWLSVHFPGYSLLVVLIAIAGIAAFLYGFVKAPLELQMFTSFATLVFFASLLSPATGETIPQWQSLSVIGSGCRYWFIPMVSFVTLLIWLLGKKQPRLIQIAAGLTLAMMVFGIALDWRHPAFANLEFKTYASKFITAPQGTKMKIPINPPGWSMELTKH